MVKLAKDYGKFFAIIGISSVYMFVCHFFTCGYIWFYSPCQMAFSSVNNAIIQITNDDVLLSYCNNDIVQIYLNVFVGVNSIALGLDNIDMPSNYFPFIDALQYKSIIGL